MGLFKKNSKLVFIILLAGLFLSSCGKGADDEKNTIVMDNTARQVL